MKSEWLFRTIEVLLLLFITSMTPDMLWNDLLHSNRGQPLSTVPLLLFESTVFTVRNVVAAR